MPHEWASTIRYTPKLVVAASSSTLHLDVRRQFAHRGPARDGSAGGWRWRQQSECTEGDASVRSNAKAGPPILVVFKNVRWVQVVFSDLREAPNERLTLV